MTNTKQVRKTQSLLLKRAENITQDLDKKTCELFLNSIKGAINKTANEMNYQIINTGSFKGWR